MYESWQKIATTHSAENNHDLRHQCPLSLTALTRRLFNYSSFPPSFLFPAVIKNPLLTIMLMSSFRFNLAANYDAIRMCNSKNRNKKHSNRNVSCSKMYTKLNRNDFGNTKSGIKRWNDFFFRVQNFPITRRFMRSFFLAHADFQARKRNHKFI